MPGAKPAAGPIPFDDMDMDQSQPFSEDLEAPQPNPQLDGCETTAERAAEAAMVDCIEGLLNISGPEANTKEANTKQRLLGKTHPRLYRESGKGILRPRIVLLTHSPLPSVGDFA